MVPESDDVLAASNRKTNYGVIDWFREVFNLMMLTVEEGGKV